MLKNSQIDGPRGNRATDADLVAASLGGDRQAFGHVVDRYQRLLCSVAYASLGNIAQSEDLAQEAFIEAWHKLPTLAEPEKLKAWLCGILRFKLSHHHRSESRRPMAAAQALDTVVHLPTDAAGVEEQAMDDEQQALLWQALENVPENYREVMVLYYREQRSMAQVAQDLDLSEATVKQRLSRGRKMLQERMMRFVEDALTRSTPGHIFTAGVIAALPAAMVATPAKAMGAGAVATQAGSAIKWTGLAAFLASASGFISSAFALRATLDRVRTKRERRQVIRTVVAFMGVALLFAVALLGMVQFTRNHPALAVPMAWTAQVIVLGFIAGYIALTARLMGGMRRLRSAERARRPERFTAEADQVDAPRREYRSRASLFGLPLVHIKFAMAEEGETPATGWIAAGERAYGILFAWGGYAVGMISVGIVSVGVVTVGAVGFGLVGVGTVGVGLLAIGAAAIGFRAYGSLSALGWDGALGGGFAIAHDAAIAPVAVAQETNSERAAELLDLASTQATQPVALLLIAALVIVPVVLYARAVRRRYKQENDGH
ncbi:sigma-70 family RNA polymerase sigma factor [Marinihelvus fidelis]|uniref:RNA polymerase sigma factor n=1 Tax=Marinihelvus fidelis TaxID=2613842 RepID=A0A5N0TI38_9GAMM|nr:sigma-70 family RNA polymerase sigma factor [Marinihelvus fidelis]KAA9134134.1 sigma-70 family RNA polymerase sigma factor [Marinihelvus fidelis]